MKSDFKATAQRAVAVLLDMAVDLELENDELRAVLAELVAIDDESGLSDDADHTSPFASNRLADALSRARGLLEKSRDH